MDDKISDAREAFNHCLKIGRSSLHLAHVVHMRRAYHVVRGASLTNISRCPLPPPRFSSPNLRGHKQGQI